jgi:hypothetical protein
MPTLAIGKEDVPCNSSCHHSLIPDSAAISNTSHSVFRSHWMYVFVVTTRIWKKIAPELFIVVQHNMNYVLHVAATCLFSRKPFNKNIQINGFVHYDNVFNLNTISSYTKWTLFHKFLHIEHYLTWSLLLYEME